MDYRRKRQSVRNAMNRAMLLRFSCRGKTPTEISFSVIAAYPYVEILRIRRVWLQVYFVCICHLRSHRLPAGVLRLLWVEHARTKALVL